MIVKIRPLSLRMEIEEAWNSGNTISDIANILGVDSDNSVYNELRLGADGTMLPNGRKKYSAQLAYERSLQEREDKIRSFDERKKIQRRYNSGEKIENIAILMGVKSRHTVMKELKLGFDGTHCSNGRRRYDADLAQRRYMEMLEANGSCKSR